MEQIKNYFKNWGITRIIRLVLSVVLGVVFYYNHESLFLFVGIILAVQAVFNISCPGGSCETSNKTSKTTEINFEKYDPKK